MANAAGNTRELNWSMAEEILATIKEPVFRDFSVNIMDFDAKTDGSLATKAIQDAIQYVNEEGGGTVIVPKGTFVTGAIRLLSGVNLHLEDKESVLLYTKEINETNYPVVYCHWESSPCYNYSPLIYAKDAENIGLTGKGTLNAQSDYESVWWNWHRKVAVPGSNKVIDPQEKGQRRLREQNDNGVAVSERVYGDGWNLRPNFVQPINCRNVLLEGVTLLDSPMWQVTPVLCTNVIVRGMTLRGHGYNTDCVDPESCNGVLIEGNLFDSGDDCIAIKSGRDRDGREINTPCENIVIVNNFMKDGHGGIALGSEMSGGIRNVFASGNHFDSPKLTYPLRLKTNAKRGGVIENVYLGDSVIDNVDQAVIHATMLYAEGSVGEFTPAFRNIVIENVKAKGGLYGIFIEAFADSPVTGLVLRNIEINGVRFPLRAMNWGPDAVMDNVRINGRRYPSPTEARILGVPVPEATVEASALLIGGDSATLSYAWEMADAAGGPFAEAGTGKTFSVPTGSAGKYLRVVVRDADNLDSASIAYKILKSATAAGIPADNAPARTAARLATRNIIDEDAAIDLAKSVTRIELARMLHRMWALPAPTRPSSIGDIDPSSGDFAVARAVVESGMMALDPHFNANLSDVQAEKEAGTADFSPNATITREEMATIAMMSCGVSYKNASHTFDTSYKDGSDIGITRLTDVERGTTLGFWDNTGYFRPLDAMTWGETLDVLDRVADFAGK